MAQTGILNEQLLSATVPARAVDTVDDALSRMHSAIMQRAYELFEAHGADEPRELDDWLKAERELFWQPSATVRERGDALEITIAMPGLRPDDVEVQVSEHEVLVQSCRSLGADTSGDTVHADEIPRGCAFRVFRVPGRLAADGAKAELRDGLLKIEVPRAADTAVRSVPVAA